MQIQVYKEKGISITVDKICGTCFCPFLIVAYSAMRALTVSCNMRLEKDI